MKAEGNSYDADRYALTASPVTLIPQAVAFQKVKALTTGGFKVGGLATFIFLPASLYRAFALCPIIVPSTGTAMNIA